MAGAEGSGAECGCLRVANAWSGAELFCTPRARAVWPDSGGEQTEHTIDVFDVLHLCGIPRHELALCDLLDERGHLLTGDMDVPWRQGGGYASASGAKPMPSVHHVWLEMSPDGSTRAMLAWWH